MNATQQMQTLPKIDQAANLPKIDQAATSSSPGHLVTVSPGHRVTSPGHRVTSWRRVLALGGMSAVVLAGALVAGAMPRLRQEQAVNAQAAAAAHRPPRVTVAIARSSPADNDRVLPGNALPLYQA